MALGIAVAAVAAVSCPAGWVSQGTPLLHDAIYVADVDFNLTSATPLIAYGYINSTTLATDVVVVQLSSNGSTWDKLVTHSPQFAQTYDTFQFRVRGGYLYLGVSDSGYGSVLRSGGGFLGFDGSWAFFGTTSSWAYAVDVAGGGNLRLLAWTGNPTMATTSSTDVPVDFNFTRLSALTYGRGGWDTYPASDTWGPEARVYEPPAPPAWGSAAFCVALAEGPPPLLFGAYAVSQGVTGVATLSLLNSSAPATQLGLSLPGAAAAVGIAWGAPWLCVSAVTAGGGTWSVLVWCTAGNATASVPAGGATWSAMGACASGTGAPPPATSIAVVAGGSVLVALAPPGAGALLSTGTAGVPGSWSTQALGPGNTTTSAVVKAAPAGSAASAVLLLGASASGSAKQETLQLCQQPQVLPASGASERYGAGSIAMLALALVAAAAVALAAGA